MALTGRAGLRAAYDSPEVVAWDTLSGKIVQRLNGAR
jgi:hypothetical protein